jgi:hypothetical protein
MIPLNLQPVVKYESFAAVEKRIIPIEKAISDMDIFQSYLYILNDLSDYFDKNVHKKRMQSVEDMYRAAEVGLRYQLEGKEEGYALFRDYIDRYFNSKFIDELLIDTEEGKLNTPKILIKYLNTISYKDRGSRIENMEHMQGACSRLLQENPENYVFLIMRSFTYINLAGQNQTEMEYGFIDLKHGLENLLKDNTDNLSITLYKSVIKLYLTEIMDNLDEETSQNVTKLVTSMYINSVLKNFNSNFTGNKGE